MTDMLLSVTTNPHARRLVRALGLPLPLPEPLARERGPWTARPLEDACIVVSAASGPSELSDGIAAALGRAGADSHVAGDAELLGRFADVASAFSRRAVQATDAGTTDALVFDASAIATVAGLRALFDFFHPRVGQLARCGRVVVIGRPSAQADSVEAAAARRALDGFVRSLAKEIGRRGATANLILVERGAERRLEPVLRFLLERRSAFVTGQPLLVSTVARGETGSAALQEPPFVRPLDGRVALITGAARGIGEATARRMALEGARVVCVDRPADGGALSRLARAIGGASCPLDVTPADAPAKLLAAARAEGGVDILVHNAGITRDKTLARMSPELWDEALLVNLAAVARTTEALVAGGALRDAGSIVCLSSIAGIAGNVGQTNYAASKAGVIGLVQALAAQLADRGIAVNAVAPGFIETRLTAAVPALVREAGRRLAALGQGGLPDDVAQVVTFLASPGARGLTAGTLRVCGGAFIGA
jgi:3-oxoacyl-[acyl-carrier protein] reductase